ncbi:Protein kinase-like domain [Pseudocohnilembus persalinus]|uniref:Protein kinase-like domain n=1 Tax=Pseudocohnilembus persalinus TaxID=266149 RepID=A0A0V0QEZ0_PSEPJ|nr:Protein kinase-like domain [Pseudocohnilembus persalinus]|eukprot:KRX00785.1 Protein kinase-like domain [Pseudocohnilembus persalinus]
MSQQYNKFASVNDYIIIKTLGSGMTSKVKLATKNVNGVIQKFALKIYKTDNKDQMQIITMIQKEILPLREIQHKNVIQLIDCLQNVDYKKKNGNSYKVFALVLEYAESGDLFEFIAQAPFSEKITKAYFYQFIDGLINMHIKGLAHRDLKPENLLLDKHYNLKIADLGFSNYMGKNNTGYMHTFLGTGGYMAPELIPKDGEQQSKYVGSQIDIFAAGIILFLMRTRVWPFTNKNPKKCDNFKLLSTHKYEDFWTRLSNSNEIIKQLSPEFKDLITNMLCFEQSSRITAAEIISHPWMDGNLATEQEIKQEFEQRKQLVEKNKQADKLKRQIIKEKQKQQSVNNNNSMFTGLNAYRSLSEEYKQQFEGLKIEFENINNERKIKILNEQEIQQNLNDIIKFLLRFYIHR